MNTILFFFNYVQFSGTKVLVLPTFCGPIGPKRLTFYSGTSGDNITRRLEGLIQWCIKSYVGQKTDVLDPFVIVTRGNLRGLPHMLIQADGGDGGERLCEDLEIFQERLVSAGVKSTLEVYAGALHDFYLFPNARKMQSKV